MKIIETVKTPANMATLLIVVISSIFVTNDQGQTPPIVYVGVLVLIWLITFIADLMNNKSKTTDTVQINTNTITEQANTIENLQSKISDKSHHINKLTAKLAEQDSFLDKIKSQRHDVRAVCSTNNDFTVDEILDRLDIPDPEVHQLERAEIRKVIGLMKEDKELIHYEYGKDTMRLSK